MNIGIIGAGNIGGTLAELFARVGHKVALSNSRGPETLADKVAELGENVTAMTAEDAAAFGDLVLEAVPFGKYRDLPADLLHGKVVMSASNYYPNRDGEMDFHGLTQTGLVAEHLPGARVVKAFNAIFWQHLRDRHAPEPPRPGRPRGCPRRRVPSLERGPHRARPAPLPHQLPLVWSRRPERPHPA